MAQSKNATSADSVTTFPSSADQRSYHIVIRRRPTGSVLFTPGLLCMRAGDRRWLPVCETNDYVDACDIIEAMMRRMGDAPVELD